MVSIGKLHGGHNGGRMWKVIAVAKLTGVEVEIDPDFKFGQHNKEPSYLAKFPLGQIPAFEGKDGLLLTESNAIAFYFASLKGNSPLLGKDVNEQAKIQQFSYFAETQLVPPLITIFMPILGRLPYVKEVEDDAYQALEKSLSYFEKELKDKKYLVGDRLTLADIIVVYDLYYVFTDLFDKEYREKYPNITRYYLDIYKIPEIKEIAGEPKLAEKRKVYVPKE